MPRTFRPELERALAEVVLDHPEWGATRIAEELKARFPDVEDPTRYPMGERTIQKRLPALRDRSGQWTMTRNEPDAPYILSVLRAVVTDESWSGDWPISVERAEWLRVVHAARPESAPLQAFAIAGAYMAATKLGWDTRAIDLALALADEPDAWEAPARRLGMLWAVSSYRGGYGPLPNPILLLGTSGGKSRS